MTGDNNLASLGEKITDVFVKTFSSANPNASLVFLPFALSVPQDIVQPRSTTDATPVVNSAQMAAFLAANFDEPYLVSPEQCAVHGKDGYYGRLSQIYPLAVTLAQPTATAGSSAWKVVTAELAMAQSVLTPAGMAYAMACAPDDWVLPGNAGYWSKFDSAEAQAAPSAPANRHRCPCIANDGSHLVDVQSRGGAGRAADYFAISARGQSAPAGADHASCQDRADRCSRGYDRKTDCRCADARAAACHCQ
jgi:hypothetical protein